MKKKIMTIASLLQSLCMRGAEHLPNAFGDGTHERGAITRKGDAVLAAAHLLVKQGSDAAHVAVTAASTDDPMGLIEHPTDAAEDLVGIRLLGKGGDTKMAVAGGEIDPGDRCVPAAAGKVVKLPTAAGTYYVIGRAVTAAAGADDAFELDDCQPYAVVVTE